MKSVLCVITRPPASSFRRLDRLIERSQRQSGARLPVAFARGAATPLAKLIQGGRGGEVRLKLYLSMVLLAGSTYRHPIFGPNVIAQVSGTNWAEILALRDPSGSGARRVADAQNSLAEMKLITTERMPGQPPKITLLNASGSGKPFVEPTAPYIRIPLTLWTQRWIWGLRSKEIAVLVALLDLCGGRDAPQALSGTGHNRYGMSEDTWRIATTNLSNLRIISTTRMPTEFDLEGRRLRKLYFLNLEMMDQEAPMK